jgi:PAS domain-containing protein
MHSAASNSAESTPDRSLCPQRSGAVAVILCYGLAVTTVAAAVAISYPLRAHLYVMPLFFAAILVSCWYGDWAVQCCVSATAEKRSHDFEYRVSAADGQTVWFPDIVTVVVEDGRPTRLRGVMVGTTDRKRPEEAARRRENELRELIEAIPDFVGKTANVQRSVVNGSMARCKTELSHQPAPLDEIARCMPLCQAVARDTALCDSFPSVLILQTIAHAVPK